ncbi:MAG TPA: type II toxin-antitoxin system VapC family toxin [Novosphingobium sp.]|nr:type II toxin-antitoxin system VapC family toxin [Novosphingobium sp.]
MTLLIDASAVLAVLLDEPGSFDAAALLNNATISAVNLSEVYRKLVDGEMALANAVEEVGRFRLKSVPFDDVQAAEAARLRPATRRLGLSLTDRACVGLANLEGYVVITADRRMAEARDVLGIDIRMIR